MHKYLLMLGLAGASSRTLASPGLDSIEAEVRQIRSRVHSINANQKRYARIEKDVHESTEGGVRQGFFQGKSLRKISALDYGEMGKGSQDLYFWNGKLIFSFRQHFHYNHHIYDAGRLKVIHVEQDRHYFRDGRMIRWIDSSKRSIPVASRDFKDEEASCIASARDDIALLGDEPS